MKTKITKQHNDAVGISPTKNITTLHSVVIAVVLLLPSMLMLAGLSEAQDTNPVKGRGPMPVELTKSLDSKKLKEGDPVMGRIMADLRVKDGTEIPRGSKVTGHVTEAKARSKGDAQSALGIVFDKISLPGGKDLTIKGEIQAVAAAPNPGNADTGLGSIGPSMMAGNRGGGTTAPPTAGVPSSLGSGQLLLNPQSKGVVGIHNLELGDNSVLVSNGKDVRLDGGMQMMVQVEIE
jgi:hypothetical protein